MSSEAPDAVAPPPGHPRFAGLDALRAVAAFAVLASHTGALTGTDGFWYGSLIAQGITGVTIFFVLSGFLLYRPFLAAQLDDLPAAKTTDYARRRLLRIVPAYWLALVVIGLWLNLNDLWGPHWWRYFGLLQVYSAHTLYGGLSAAWTLCIEITFYLLLPLYAVAMATVGRGRSRHSRVRLELWVLLALGLLSFGFHWYVVADRNLALWATLPSYFTWFAVGMALAVVSVGPVAPRLRAFVTDHPAACWLVAGLTYVVCAALLSGQLLPGIYYSTGKWMTQHALSALVAVALVAPAALATTPAGWPHRVLAWRWLAWLGLISYGVYLWQGAWVEQIDIWAGRWGLGAHSAFGVELIAVAAGSIVCAALSYRIVERPLMRFKYHGRRAAKPPAAAARESVPIGVVLAGAAKPSNDALDPPRRP